MDRLALDPTRISAIADAVRSIAALPDPVGEVIDGHRLPNGLDVRKVRVPLGVVAVIYESRPNVTVDAAALALKSGNAVVLRGSAAAAHSNAVLASIVAPEFPDGAVALLTGGREQLAELATQEGVVDLIIPRGGEGLKKALQRRRARCPSSTPRRATATSTSTRPPTSTTRSGSSSTPRRSAPASATRPRRCSCTPTSPRSSCPLAGAALRDAGVELRAEERAAALLDGAVAATDEDFGEEFLALILAVKVVGSYEEAIAHVNQYGSGHSEAIVTGSAQAARAFQLGVDAACVYVNASTRFTDGGEFGMGAEIGNSTQKLHARGPIGLRELCTFKYLVEGDGQARP